MNGTTQVMVAAEYGPSCEYATLVQGASTLRRRMPECVVLRDEEIVVMLWENSNGCASGLVYSTLMARSVMTLP